MSHMGELAEELADVQRELTLALRERDEARQSAARWETEAKTLRAELSRVRQEASTERFSREEHA